MSPDASCRPEPRKSAHELEASGNNQAYAHTDRYLGPRQEVGNKGGSRSNRLRKVLEL